MLSSPFILYNYNQPYKYMGESSNFQNPELLEFKFKNLNMLYANKSFNGQMFLDELKIN